MQKEKIANLLNDFKEHYDEKKSKAIWQRQSEKVKEFWKKYVLVGTGKIGHAVLDPILVIFDSKARGAGPESGIESVGFPYIYQDMWYDIFDDIKESSRLKGLLTQLFESKSSKKEIVLLNEISKANTNSNGLTGHNANVLNDLMFAFNPERNISIVSLKHRYQILEFLGHEDTQKIDTGTYGARIILSRDRIIEAKNSFKVNIDNRGWSKFFYWKSVKELWKDKKEEEPKKRNDSEPKSHHDKLIKLLIEYGKIFGFETINSPSVNDLKIGKEFSKNKTLDLAWKVAGVAWIAFEVQMHGSIPDLLHRFQLVNQASLRLVVVVDKSEHEYMEEAAGEYLFRDKLVALTPEQVEKAAMDHQALLELRNKIFS